MLILNNYKDSLIKLSSELLAKVFQNPNDYLSVEITGNITCCGEETYSRKIEFNPVVIEDCTQCSGIFAWRLNLAEAANSNTPIKAINITNVVSGITYNILENPINFTAFKDLCGNGSCTLEDMIQYQTLFSETFTDWFEYNVQWFNTKVGFCGNTLTVCSLPPNFIVSSVEYDTDKPYKELFSFNETRTEIILNQDLYISPFLFELPSFTDGVYKFKVRITKKDGSWTEETNCFFLDINTKCKVSRFIEGIIEKKEEANNIHLAHYALINASNCGCNCEELCELYKYLLKLLDNNTSNIKDCGC